MALERCVTSVAYELRLCFKAFTNGRMPGEVRNSLGNGCAWVQAMREQAGDLLEPMARAARMIERTWMGFWPIGLKV